LPDYQITIHMRNGSPKTGIRWHNSYDGDFVRKIVEEKIKHSIGMSGVKWTVVDIVSHMSGPRIETKPLI
jgi:hypothetical protein